MALRILLVSTWGTACGIAEHSWYLKQAVEAADASIEILPSVESLDPYHLLYATDWTRDPLPLIHLNYHAALHSRWGVEQIAKMQALGAKVLVTYHDTGTPNTDQTRAILRAADAGVVHEPYDDLPSQPHYWRMGVPDWQPAIRPLPWACPLLGSIGFPFGWKNYDQLAEITGRLGWGLFLIAPTATSEQVTAWRALNPRLHVRSDFVQREEAISLLSGCDATAFAYVCHNTGQSAAILQGIAARKPVVALATCRQFRGLFKDPLGRTTITWAETFEDLAFNLLHFTPITGRPSAPIVALAEQESWRQLGVKYAALYRELAS